MHLDELMTDSAVLAELGRRLARHRLERNWTQAELAAEAGVGQATVQRAERGESVQMTSMIKLLRTLELLGGLDLAVPESIDLPIAQLEREQRKLRRRASGAVGARSAAPGPGDGEAPPAESGERPWTWGDEPGAAAMTVAAVTLWGARIAAVSIEEGARYATFQYDPAFVRSGIEIAPVQMALRTQPYSFPGLPRGRVQRSPGAARGLPPRPLGDGARQRMAGLAGARRSRASTSCNGSAMSAPAGSARWSSSRPTSRRRPPARTSRSMRSCGSRARCSRSARSSWPS